MAPHQERVVEEKRALDEKLAALTGFYESPTFSNLDDQERGRLFRQGNVMRLYSAILAERIVAFQ